MCEEQTSDYIPIDCEQYARYELAIMHHERLRLVWQDAAGVLHMESVLPCDLQTRCHVEYLHARRADNSVLILRLDWIRRADAC